MEVVDINLASSEAVEIKPEDIESDQEDAIDSELLQNFPSHTLETPKTSIHLREPHSNTSNNSVNIQESNGNLASSKGIEIKPENIESGPENLPEQHHVFPSNTLASPNISSRELYYKSYNNHIANAVVISENNLASSEAVEIKPEDIESDHEDAIVPKLLQNFPSHTQETPQISIHLREPHSNTSNNLVNIQESNGNLTFSKGVEIKLENIESGPKNLPEQHHVFPSNTLESPNISSRELNYKSNNNRIANAVNITENNQNEGEFQYVCNTIKEELQVLNVHGKVEEHFAGSTSNNKTQTTNSKVHIQRVCIDLAPVSDHETTEKSSRNGTRTEKLANHSAQIHTTQIIKPLFALTRDCNKEKVSVTRVCDKEKVSNRTIAVSIRAGIPSKNLSNERKENGEKQNINKNKYFFDKSIHDDEFIMKPVGYDCVHCPYFSSSWLHMRNHIKFQHRDPDTMSKRGKQTACPYCPKKLVDIDGHISKCHPEYKDLDWLYCGHCDYKTKIKDLLIMHITARHSITSDQEVKVCETCGKSYKTQHGLTAHKKIAHPPETAIKLKCDYCSFTTQLKYALRRHMYRHKDPEEGFKCSKCEFHTKSIKNLVKHQKEHWQWHQCHMCSYGCRSIGILKLHLIHHQEKKKDEDMSYKCTKCDYKTYRVYNLQVHMLKHKNPKEIEMFHCYHCDFKSNRKDNLKTHIFKHDIYKEVFSCFICTFNTSSSYELKKHVDVHSVDQRKEEAEAKMFAGKKRQIGESTKRKNKKKENGAKKRKQLENLKKI